MKYIFVGGVFPDNQIEMINNSSSGVIQNAADVFQKNLLKGLGEVFPNEFHIINLPFVGSYPRRFNKFYYPSCSFIFSKNISFHGLGFLNITGLKYFFRFFSLLFGFSKINKKDIDYIFVYSLHLPFLLAAVFIKKIQFKNIKICVIVPDLPEYMSDNSSFFYCVFKRVESYIFKYLFGFVDKYIFLTKEMASRIGVEKENYIVIEGVADDIDLLDIGSYENKIIFYSGTLAKRYGVCDLVDAFSALESQGVELWICGEGDSKEYIQAIGKINKRVKYLGQLPRVEILKLQQKATLLVNPRKPDGEYTKYSFPSKIMEYMSSGRPVIMYKLPGIPEEYFDFCYTINGTDPSHFKDCLSEILKLSDEELNAKGSAARDFVINNKSYLKQAEKIKEFILE